MALVGQAQRTFSLGHDPGLQCGYGRRQALVAAGVGHGRCPATPELGSAQARPGDSPSWPALVRRWSGAARVSGTPASKETWSSRTSSNRRNSGPLCLRPSLAASTSASSSVSQTATLVSEIGADTRTTPANRSSRRVQENSPTLRGPPCGGRLARSPGIEPLRFRSISAPWSLAGSPSPRRVAI